MSDWLVEHDRLLEAIAALLFISGVLLAAIPRTRRALKRAPGAARRLGARIPLRIVKTDTLRRLRTPDQDLERYRPPQFTTHRAEPLSLQERSMKLLAETKDAASRYDAMTVHERHELNAYFQPH